MTEQELDQKARDLAKRINELPIDDFGQMRQLLNEVEEVSVELNKITYYNKAVVWLEKHQFNANKRGDHNEQRVIDYIKEMLWQYEDMRNS